MQQHGSMNVKSEHFVSLSVVPAEFISLVDETARDVLIQCRISLGTISWSHTHTHSMCNIRVVTSRSIPKSTTILTPALCSQEHSVTKLRVTSSNKWNSPLHCKPFYVEIRMGLRCVTISVFTTRPQIGRSAQVILRRSVVSKCHNAI
jgi:hypothetical protein